MQEVQKMQKGGIFPTDVPPPRVPRYLHLQAVDFILVHLLALPALPALPAPLPRTVSG
jgi:hypothetical protein